MQFFGFSAAVQAAAGLFSDRQERKLQYLRDYTSVRDLIAKLDSYFEYYNTERAHEAFGLLTPSEAYASGSNNAEAA
ncbi:MAG: integrase core domain-containing protein [Polyangia bacterium]